MIIVEYILLLLLSLYRLASISRESIEFVALKCTAKSQVESGFTAF
jgi:hypothetical protein